MLLVFLFMLCVLCRPVFHSRLLMLLAETIVCFGDFVASFLCLPRNPMHSIFAITKHVGRSNNIPFLFVVPIQLIIPMNTTNKFTYTHNFFVFKYAYACTRCVWANKKKIEICLHSMYIQHFTHLHRLYNSQIDTRNIFKMDEKRSISFLFICFFFFHFSMLFSNWCPLCFGKIRQFFTQNTQNMLRNHSSHNKEKSFELVPCCTATQFSSLQLFYMENNSTATRKTLPNMVVEACGCM